MLLIAPPSQAEPIAGLLRHASTDYCSSTPNLGPEAQDRLLLLAGQLRAELQRARPAVALIARSGLDLARFGQRYSHAALVLPDAEAGVAPPGYTVRQLYYACDERRPRLFDQGLAGFVMGMGRPERGHVSLLMLPPGAEADRLAAAARDTPRALQLLAAEYSANAYAYNTRYQNCNQWVAELLGLAWDDGAAPSVPADSTHARAQAQAWLAAAGYQPAAIPVGPRWLLALAAWAPLVHLDDHPAADVDALTLHISMPGALQAFVQQRLPQAQRLELCHAPGQVLLRRAGPPLDDDCTPQTGDERLATD